MNENWLFTARLPITDATRSERGQPDVDISGLGDASIAVTYSPWAGDNSPWSPLNFSAGFTLPTGEARDNPLIGGVTPSVFQLGTGTTQITLEANYFGKVNDDWSYFMSSNVTLPLYESSKEFRPAETFFFRAGMGHTFSDSLAAKLSLDLFHGERDEFLGNEIGITGSTTLSLKPSLVYSINENLNASASVELPIYRRVNETALSVGSLWSFGLSYSF